MAEIARLSTRDTDFDARLARLTAFDAAQDETLDRTVAEILAAVKSRGDAAVLEYTARFDGVTAGAIAELELPRELLARARDGLPAVQREARVEIRLARRQTCDLSHGIFLLLPRKHRPAAGSPRASA